MVTFESNPRNIICFNGSFVFLRPVPKLVSAIAFVFISVAKQGKVSAKIQQLLNTLKVITSFFHETTLKFPQKSFQCPRPNSDPNANLCENISSTKKIAYLKVGLVLH